MTTLTNPRDTQRSKVFNLRFGPYTELPLAECERLIKDAHTAYGLVWGGRIHDGGGMQNARGGPSKISLPKWARTADTVLHEAAHAVLMQKFGRYRYAHHGPEFVRVWMNLLELHKVTTAGAFRREATLAKVKVSREAKFDRMPARAASEYERLRVELVKARAEVKRIEARMHEIRTGLTSQAAREKLD